MKRNRLISSLFAAVLLLALSASAAKDPARPYAWRLPLQGEVTARQHYRVTLPGVVYDRALQFPTDLRVVDGTAALWPHVLLKTDKGELRHLAVEERNRSISKGARPYHRLDLVMTEQGDVRHDRVIIKTSGQRFIRMTEVYGAEEGGDWVLLGKGYLIRDHRPHHVHQTAVTYPLSDFPRLQVRIYPNAEDATEAFTVQSIKVQGHIRIPPAMELLASAPVETDAADRKEDAEVLVVDLGHKNRPFDRVRIPCERADYIRTVSIHGRNDEKETWRYLGCGDIQALDGCVRSSVDVTGKHRYVKCSIFHYDDQPLGISAIEVLAVPDVLLVEAGEGGDPCLYVGNEFAKAPRYDLSRRQDRVKVATLPLLALGEIEENSGYRRGGFGKLGPWLAGIAVALVSVLVLYVIIGMLKQAGAPAGDASG
ncbi:MAG: hypothetical protein ISS31_05605 [Kiritimatiellae bacterium]|nr:hypothetical protein [Kiritimatiellia bacterium]